MKSLACRVWQAAAPLLLLPPGLQATQLGEGGAFEIGAFASLTRYDATRLALASDFGAGVRGGWYLSRVFSLEATASRTLTRRTADAGPVGVTEIGGSLIATMRMAGSLRLFLGGGYSRLRYGGDQPFDDQAVHFVIGNRIPLSQRAAFRIDARGHYSPSTRAPAAPGGSAMSAAVSGGVSVFFAERPPPDSDGDLIANPRDECPATPPEAHVDARGCPRDGDRDGSYDGLDRCPATPAGARVDGGGCPLDGDRDGVPDGLDACEGSDTGFEIDEKGCEIRRDSDADGVLDRYDRCTGTSAGQRVDDVGCPILFEERGGEVRPLVLKGVNFELDRAILTPESHAVLDEVAASLLVHIEVRIEVAGHTDETGSAQHNASLSLARAETVRNYLMARGVGSDRMIPRGYGALYPVASNVTDEGRALNRRVELRLISR